MQSFDEVCCEVEEKTKGKLLRNETQHFLC